MGADPTAAQDLFAKAEGAIRKGAYREAAQLAKKGFQTAQQTQFQRVVGALATSREKFAAAANMGIDLKAPFEDLNPAREAIRRGAFREALDYAKRADGAVDAILDRYRKVEVRLKELHRSFAEVEGFGVQTLRARKLAEAARQAYQDRNPPEVEKAIQASFEELRRAERERVMEAIERTEFILTLGEQNGADLSEPSRSLQEAIVAVKADDYRRALDLAAAVQAKVGRILAERAAGQISSLRTALPHRGDESGTLKALINRADASMAGQDFEGALKAVAEGQAFVEARVQTRADEIVGDLAVAVRIGVDLGANVSNLEALHRELNAYLASGRAAEIVGTREKATEALAGLADNLLGLVRGRVATIQGLKVDVDEMNDLVRRARMALGVQNYHEGLRLLNEANDHANKAAGMHKQAYNAIATAAAFVADAKKRNVDVSKVVEMLVDAKKAFEQMDLERALQLAGAARAETDKLTVLYSSAQKILSSRGRLELAERLGIAAPHLREVFADAKEAMKAKEYEKALGLAQRTEDEFTSLIRERLLLTLNEAEEILTSVEGADLAASTEALGKARGQARREGTDTRSSERLFEKARELFRAKKYRQAIATALQSEAEAERVGLQQQIAKQAVESVEGKLRDLGKGSSIVMDLVSDSRKAFAVGDYVKALDTAIHASDSIADLRVLLDEVAEVREKAKALLQTALEVGADASKFEKAFQDGESAFELGEVERARAAFAGSIEWGHSLLASYLRDQLTKAEGLLEMCRKMDVDPTAAMNRFAEARTRLEAGDFQEAMANIRSARDEASTALAAKLNRALQDAADNVAHAKRLGSDARDAEALLRQANERILRGEYDNAMDVVNNALERVESAKIIEKRFVDLTFKAETTIRNGRKFGIDMKLAETKLAQAVQLRKSDFAEATRSAEESYRLAWEATEAFAPSMRGFLDVVPARVNEWADATLTVENEGKGAAKDVRVRILGDAETAGTLALPAVRAHASEALRLRLKMTASGSVPLAIQIVSQRDFDDKEYTQEMIAQIDVSEVGAEKAKRLVAALETRCPICKGLIKKGFKVTRCRCGRDFHELCASRVGRCPVCFRSIQRAPER